MSTRTRRRRCSLTALALVLSLGGLAPGLGAHRRLVANGGIRVRFGGRH